MSDSTGEDLKVASGAEPATGQASNPAMDRGPRGEDAFANQAWAATHPAEAAKEDQQFTAFLEQERAKTGVTAAREVINQQSIEPRVSRSMEKNAYIVDTMMADPAKRAQIEREMAMARGQATSTTTGPILDMTPPTTWGRMKDTIATFFGFGKKQEPIREI